jgi:hypothetical protein
LTGNLPGQPSVTPASAPTNNIAGPGRAGTGHRGVIRIAPSAAYDVERRGLLGQRDRVIERDLEDGRRDPHPGIELAREPGKGRDGLQAAQLAVEVVLGERDVRQSVALGGRHLTQQFIHLDPRIGARMPITDEKAYLHVAVTSASPLRRVIDHATLAHASR